MSDKNEVVYIGNGMIRIGDRVAKLAVGSRLITNGSVVVPMTVAEFKDLKKGDGIFYFGCDCDFHEWQAHNGGYFTFEEFGHYPDTIHIMEANSFHLFREDIMLYSASVIRPEKSTYRGLDLL